MKSTAKLKLVIALALLISVATLLQSCGKENTIPDGSALIINPSAVTLNNVPTDTPQNFTVVARYQDGIPIPYARIHISGSFGVPFVPSQYQFYYYPDGTWNPDGNVAVDSGFTGQTDKYGVYTFSIVVFGGTVFDDTIYFNSGTATASVTVSATTST